MPEVTTSKQFKEARQKLGLSVAEAAEVCRVDSRTIRRWETGAGHGDGRDPHPSACRIMEIELDKRKAKAS
jgi:DNA-binding transcriptional regulator YiaG